MKTFDAVDLDVTSAYLAAASNVGVWPLLSAERIEPVDERAFLASEIERAVAGDVSVVFDLKRSQRLAWIAADVLLSEEPDELPVTTAGDLAGFHALRHVSAAPGTRPVLPVAGPDLFISALRTRKTPDVLAASGLQLSGEQPGLRRSAPIYDGRRVGEDPFLALAKLRLDAKADGRTAEAASLRIVALAAAYGIFGRRLSRRERGRMVERPGRFYAPYVAAAVTSTVRMWLAVIEHLLAEAEITVMARDTDGLLLACAPKQWPALDTVLARFEAINPYPPGVPFWKVLREHHGRSLRGLVLAVKRYVIWPEGRPDEPVEFTEHALCGSVVEPPGFAGRLPNGKHSRAATVATAVAKRAESTSGSPIRWDWESFPVLEPLRARRRADFERVRTALRGLRPFGHYVRAGRERARDPVPLTLDDGTDFTNWYDHAFYGPNGEPLEVTTDWGGAGVLLRTLGAGARRWAQPSPRDVSPIVVDPDLIRCVGGPGPVLEALRADREADPDAHRVVVTEEDATAIVRVVAKRVGPRAFSRLAKIPYQDARQLVIGGRKTRRSTVRRAFAGVRSAQVPRCRRDGCDGPITRSRQLYCSPACREAARRTRLRAEGARR